MDKNMFFGKTIIYHELNLDSINKIIILLKISSKFIFKDLPLVPFVAVEVPPVAVAVPPVAVTITVTLPRVSP